MILLVSAQLFTANSIAQKTLSEGTIVYNISVESKKAENNKESVLNGAKSILYLKGSSSRSEMISSLGNETSIFNAKTGSAVILREYSGQKLMITLSKANWDEKNKKYNSLLFDKSTETKMIKGYSCQKATGKLSDGSIITVFYATDLGLTNKDYTSAFKNLPGLPMEYELETENMKFTYTVSEIDLNSISAVKFEFPKSGYRVMSYEDNKQVKKEG